MYTLDNIILIIAMIFTYKYGSHPFILNEYLEIAASGLLFWIGIIFLNKAVTMGLAGPVFALANIQVIIQTILDAIFVGSIPTTLEIVSAALGILGCCTIALGPEMYSWLKNVWYKKKED